MSNKVFWTMAALTLLLLVVAFTAIVRGYYWHGLAAALTALTVVVVIGDNC